MTYKYEYTSTMNCILFLLFRGLQMLFITEYIYQQDIERDDRLYCNSTLVEVISIVTQEVTQESALVPKARRRLHDFQLSLVTMAQRQRYRLLTSSASSIKLQLDFRLVTKYRTYIHDTVGRYIAVNIWPATTFVVQPAMTSVPIQISILITFLVTFDYDFAQTILYNVVTLVRDLTEVTGIPRFCSHTVLQSSGETSYRCGQPRWMVQHIAAPGSVDACFLAIKTYILPHLIQGRTHDFRRGGGEIRQTS